MSARTNGLVEYGRYDVAADIDSAIAATEAKVERTLSRAPTT